MEDKLITAIKAAGELSCDVSLRDLCAIVEAALAGLEAEGYTIAKLVQEGDWCPDHGLVNIGDPWNWDYNDDHHDYDEHVEPLFRKA